jgi:hypothetical protein
VENLRLGAGAGQDPPEVVCGGAEVAAGAWAGGWNEEAGALVGAALGAAELGAAAWPGAVDGEPGALLLVPGAPAGAAGLAALVPGSAEA